MLDDIRNQTNQTEGLNRNSDFNAIKYYMQKRSGELDQVDPKTKKQMEYVQSQLRAKRHSTLLQDLKEIRERQIRSVPKKLRFNIFTTDIKKAKIVIEKDLQSASQAAFNRIKQEKKQLAERKLMESGVGGIVMQEQLQYMPKELDVKVEKIQSNSFLKTHNQKNAIHGLDDERANALLSNMVVVPKLSKLSSVGHFFNKEQQVIVYEDLPHDLKVITGQVEENETQKVAFNDEIFHMDLRKCNFDCTIKFFQSKISKNNTSNPTRYKKTLQYIRMLKLVSEYQNLKHDNQLQIYEAQMDSKATENVRKVMKKFEPTLRQMLLKIKIFENQIFGEESGNESHNQSRTTSQKRNVTMNIRPRGISMRNTFRLENQKNQQKDPIKNKSF